jgi:hypothetical protein
MWPRFVLGSVAINGLAALYKPQEVLVAEIEEKLS